MATRKTTANNVYTFTYTTKSGEKIRLKPMSAMSTKTFKKMRAAEEEEDMMMILIEDSLHPQDVAIYDEMPMLEHEQLLEQWGDSEADIDLPKV